MLEHCRASTALVEEPTTTGPNSSAIRIVALAAMGESSVCGQGRQFLPARLGEVVDRELNLYRRWRPRRVASRNLDSSAAADLCRAGQTTPVRSDCLEYLAPVQLDDAPPRGKDPRAFLDPQDTLESLGIRRTDRRAAAVVTGELARKAAARPHRLCRVESR